jgi:hypothetical integral membrane protein (TIGR02206 family)
MHLHGAYGIVHISWLAGITCMAIGLSLVCRRNLVPNQYVRAVLACVLAGGEIMRFFTDDIRFPDHVPLNLCNVTAWVAVIACVTLSPVAVEFAYFAGFCGAGMALLTPDLGTHWPARFFVNHGAIILAGSAFVYGRISPLRWGAVWRAYGCFAIYIGLIGLFDWKYRVNFAYLCTKPRTGTLLSLLGPWPYYVLGAGAVALALFWMLWLPARPSRAQG